MAKKEKPKPLKLEEMQEQYKQKQSIQETAQNFYSFLHKRNRFYDNDVKTSNPNNQKETTHHKKFDVKKINIENSVANGKNVNHSDLLQSFKFWNYVNFPNFYKDFAKRHKDNAETITANNLKVQNFKPDWRLAIGLGSGSVFETSISLHHVYGFPYIPASAIKGALRSYLITFLYNANETEAFKVKEMCDIFGCPAEIDREKTHYREEREGNIIFFDAYPCESPQGKIKADIMNNHYDKWYNEGKPPADYYNPNPIIFLTVEKLTFQFMVGLQKGVENTAKFWGKNKDMLSVVSDLLKDALQEKGIGAKTAVGYGYMQ